MPADPKLVESVFHRAAALPPADREAFLAGACGDADLRQRVERLLAADAELGEFLGRPAADPDATRTAPGWAPTADPRPAEEAGAVVAGRYKLLEQIGEGGMGTVWMAEQREPVKRLVALKLIKPGMDSRQVLARFEAERQALALMDHPNIARVFDGGTTAEGRPYFVMELVKGIPLTSYCDERRLTVPERLGLFAAVCSAVQHAHQKGVIHRDLKPSNVLVTEHDGKPVPKVIDFGLAKALHATNVLTDKTLHTAYGAVVGTPLYMAPEQVGINALDVDTRTDVYALGVILYELLTGTTPLEKGRLKEALWDEVRRLIREEEPPRPSTRLSTSAALPAIAARRHAEPARLSRLVRGDLDWIVMKALEKDRGRRYETASAFVADVERFLRHEAILARPPSAAYKLRKFARRNRAAVVAGGAVAAALVLGTIVATWQAVRATRAEAAALAERDQKEQARQAEEAQRKEAETQRDRAAKAEADAKEQAAIAQAVNDFLQKDLLAQASPDHEPDRDLRLRTLLDRAAKEIEGKFPRQPLVEASIRQTIAETYMALSLHAAAQPHLKRALDLRSRHLGEDHRETLWSMNSLALLLRGQDKPAEAEALYRRTLELRRRALGDEDPDTATTMSQLSLILEQRGDLAGAEELMRKVVPIFRRALGEEHNWTLGGNSRLTDILFRRGKLTVVEEEALRRKNLEIRRRVDVDGHPDTLLAIHDFCWFLLRQGKLDEAERLCREGLDTSRRVLGEEHDRTLFLQTALAKLLRARGDYAAAEPYFVKALEVYRRERGEEHMFTLFTMTHLAGLYRDQGKYDQAERLAARAVEVCRRSHGEEHLSTIEMLSALASIYEAQGKSVQAEPLFAKVLEVQRRAGDRALLWTDSPLACLAANLLRQRKFAQAEPLLRECLNTPEPMQPNGWLRFHAQCLLGRSLAGQEKYADAEPLMLAGYAGLKAREQVIPFPDRNRTVTEALGWLAQLYDEWGNPDEAARWRAERAKYPPEQAPPPRAVK